MKIQYKEIPINSDNFLHDTSLHLHRLAIHTQANTMFLQLMYTKLFNENADDSDAAAQFTKILKIAGDAYLTQQAGIELVFDDEEDF